MHHLISEFHRTPWAMLPSTLAVMQEVLYRWASGVKIGRAGVAECVGRAPAESAARRDSHQSMGGGAIAVLPVFGIIAHRAAMVSDISSGVNTSTEALGRQLKAALADDSVSTIVLDVDSPGGSVHGVAEIADQIYSAREQKRIIASVNSLAASAAYWIASAAQEIAITPSGEAGSIGVYAAHQDVSSMMELAGVKQTLISAGRYKVEGNPFEPLSDEARAAIQGSVNMHYDAFVSGVARNRGDRIEAVRDGYGEGRVLGAAQAVSAGLADRIATFDQVISELRAGRRPSTARRRLALSSH